MGRVDLSGLDGIRAPTPEEVRRITRYYEHLYRENDKSLRVLNTVFFVLGFICAWGYTVNGASSLVVAAIFLAMGFGMLRARRKSDADLEIFRRGDFIVIPGRVCGIWVETTGLLGVSDVEFISEGGRRLDARFHARRTQLQMGTPLLLMHVDEKTLKHGMTRVFTPFMLSEEGLKGTLF